MIRKEFKKGLALTASALLMGLGLCGCQDNAGQAQVQPEEQISYEIAMVTDDSLIMEGGHSQVIWDAVTDFGVSQGKSHKYYKAVDASENACNQVIQNAIDNGAKVIVADGYGFDKAVLNYQKKYKDVNFILIDAEAIEEGTGNILIENNTTAVTFKSNQAGYLAGYAAVMDGYTELGFIAESGSHDVNAFGIGYVRGANKAADELDISVNMNYKILSGAKEMDSVRDLASKWYAEGTQVIMVSGHDIENKVVEAAEASDGKVIATVADRSQLSDTVITTAEQDIAMGLGNALSSYAKDEFTGGQVVEYGAAEDGIGLSMSTSRFNSFNNDQYKDMYKKLASGEIKVKVNGVESVNDLKVNHVVIK